MKQPKKIFDKTMLTAKITVTAEFINSPPCACLAVPCEVGVKHRETYFTGVASENGTGVAPEDGTGALSVLAVFPVQFVRPFNRGSILTGPFFHTQPFKKSLHNLSTTPDFEQRNVNGLLKIACRCNQKGYNRTQYEYNF
jgi:hypothetical protein